MDPIRIIESVIQEMGIAIPGNVLHDGLRLSEDLRIDSLQFILFVLKLEQGLGRKAFDAESIGAMKTIADIRLKMQVGETAASPRPVAA